MPCFYRASFQAISQGHGMVYVGDPPRFGFFPTAARSFTIDSSDFSGYTRTFTKGMALSEDGRGTGWYV
jgi:hypothetical protein